MRGDPFLSSPAARVLQSANSSARNLTATGLTAERGRSSARKERVKHAAVAAFQEAGGRVELGTLALACGSSAGLASTSGRLSPERQPTTTACGASAALFRQHDDPPHQHDAAGQLSPGAPPLTAAATALSPGVAALTAARGGAAVGAMPFPPGFASPPPPDASGDSFSFPALSATCGPSPRTGRRERASADMAHLMAAPPVPAIAAYSSMNRLRLSRADGAAAAPSPPPRRRPRQWGGSNPAAAGAASPGPAEAPPSQPLSSQ